MLLVVGSIALIFIMVFLLGPRAPKPDYSSLVVSQFSSDLKTLEDSINRAEASLNVKRDNEARIVWARPYEQTEYSIVYLHGNGASQEEGDPIHEAIAHRYGCNLFLARLADHGLIDKDPMIDIDGVEWMQSALNALMVGHKLGKKVIVVSTSTGSTLSLYLGAHYPDLVDAHIMMSPNVDLYDSRSFILTYPYGLQIARKLAGSKFYGWKGPGPAQDYWYTSYRIEGLCTLKSIINCTMTDETFAQVEDPLLLLYYYRDEEHQDQVVSVARMREMFQQLGTSDDMKTEVAIPDANTHIIGSDIFNSNLGSVWSPIIKFCEEVLNLNPVNDTDWKPFLDQR